MIHRMTIALYLALTFGLTWGLALALLVFPDTLTDLFGPLTMTNPLFLLAVYAPAIAAVILVGREGGLGGLARFAGRLALWRCHPGWYAFILLGIPALMWTGAAIKGPFDPIPFGSASEALAAFAVVLVVGPVEEFGWRGVLLPLLQRRLAPIHAGLVLGVIWGIWHVPAFLLGGTPQSNWDFLPYFAALVSLSVIMTALFNASRGSLLLAMLVHFQANNPMLPDAQPYDAVTFVAVALLIVWICRRALFDRSGAVTTVIPNRS
jgi:membrane protease YdiL (CAAX protease family)